MVVLWPAAHFCRRNDPQRAHSVRLRRQETSFRGPTCFQRGDNNYYNAQGDKIATQRSTSIRYRSDLAREMGSLTATRSRVDRRANSPSWKRRNFEYIKSLHDLGHAKRYWDDVSVGDTLPLRVFGPHSIASFATEWRAYLFTHLGWNAPAHRSGPGGARFEPDLAGHENDPVMERRTPS